MNGEVPPIWKEIFQDRDKSAESRYAPASQAKKLIPEPGPFLDKHGRSFAKRTVTGSKTSFPNMR
jgi:hypothetical protein